MNNEEKQMTVQEALANVCARLSNIDVPVSKVQEIGIPIAMSINEINLCIEAMSRSEEKKEQEDA